MTKDTTKYFVITDVNNCHLMSIRVELEAYTLLLVAESVVECACFERKYSCFRQSLYL